MFESDGPVRIGQYRVRVFEHCKVTIDKNGVQRRNPSERLISETRTASFPEAVDERGREIAHLSKQGRLDTITAVLLDDAGNRL